MNANIDITGITLRTDRLILRPWRQEDLEDFYEYARVDGVGQMAGWLPHESKDVTQAVLDSFIEHRKTFALQYQGKVIGSLGIENYKEDAFGELDRLRGRSIGYVLSKDYWGCGLMPEAVKAVIDYCFTKLDFDYLTCCHFDWNRQSQRVIEKSGFTFLKDTLFEKRDGVVENSKKYVIYNPHNLNRVN